MQSYKEFSQIYDLLMDDIDYQKWTSFIISKINGSRKVLEAACGTGSITRLLADANYRVTAFDLSQDMLMRAYEKLGRNPGVRLLNQNMTKFIIDDKFDSAICCCDGINYLTEEETEMFFKNIYDHLNNNSRFIFDMSTEYKYETLFNDTYVYDDGDVFYVWENMIDKLNNTVDIEINFFIKDSENKYSRITEEQIQYIHSAENIIKLLKAEGFDNIEIYDDYNNESFTNKSLRAVFCATKLKG
ncbi:MAG: class I SAM-dependent methyltransferase [Sedimentibacter sp.]|uniref:class I SAM-dependent DNA methyltransferase n=1 Tax=Sedimentibacter sp. TaxID=1960295 RepID=UPI002981BCA9|nr:class I SAM-dependent methyltransferase [Sedimentibacter sp.]MDW5298792.1 class I SAM-dependent methyltransferase [Sedimentibacter sp.]